MDTFDVADDQEAPRRRGGIVWNVLTILVLVSTLCLTAFMVMLLYNPSSGLNPYPPPTWPVILPPPTITHTPRVVLEPSWTPTSTSEVVLPTKTPRPTNTPFQTETPYGMSTPTATITPTPSEFSFVLQQGSPVSIANIFYPDLGCSWMGVGGQVLDISGGPVIGLTIHLYGTLNGQVIDQRTLTGVNQSYGDGGFEFKLANTPVASQGSLWIQLLDQADLPMSDNIFFDTYEDCGRNLIVINLVQVK